MFNQRYAGGKARGSCRDPHPKELIEKLPQLRLGDGTHDWYFRASQGSLLAHVQRCVCMRVCASVHELAGVYLCVCAVRPCVWVWVCTCVCVCTSAFSTPLVQSEWVGERRCW